MNQSRLSVCLFKRNKLYVNLFVLFLPVFVLFGCGGGGGGGGGSEPVNIPALIKSATVKIDAEGAFREPSGFREGSGRGSGFIVSQNGHIVTNSHVVNGSTIRKVFVEGRDQPIDAELIAVSECSDLAVIKLISEDIFPTLKWFDGVITEAIGVFAAGFPTDDGGNVTYKLTPGSITSLPVTQNFRWASVQKAIDHTALIRPGNSGGPLVVKETGRVIGVNYAVSDKQNFSIAVSEARDIIENFLIRGKDHLSIGINGREVNFTSGRPAGIWVRSVRPGKEAFRLGINPGDRIVNLGGLSLLSDVSKNKSMENFCSILKNNDPQKVENVIPVVILRQLTLTTGQVCTGAINGAPLTCGRPRNKPALGGERFMAIH